MGKVYKKKNYTTTAAEKLDLETEALLLGKKLVKRLNYDLCTQAIENKLAYIRARLAYIDRN